VDILILIASHLVGDYVLQNDFLATNKGGNSFILFVHSALWTLAVAIGFYVIGIELGIIAVLYLVITHMIIDKMKCQIEDKTYALTRDLYLDQILHLVTILMVYYI